MSHANKERQNLIAIYKELTGKTEIDMREVAQWAMEHGYAEPPKPKDPVDVLARQLSRAAQQERRTDSATGSQYRAYHSVVQRQPNGAQLSLWVDIDDAPRATIEASAAQRRTGIINDAVQLRLDLEHWNRVNPVEAPICMEFDIDEEVEWEKHAREAEREQNGDTGLLH